MKKILITLFLFAALILSANSVNIEQAKQVATNWFIERGDISNYEIFDVQIEKEKSINLYYIFNFEQDAYVMVAADDAIVPILGYCFEQHFTSENHPPQFDAMLNSFKKQIIYAKDGNASAAEWVSDEWKRLSVKSENFEKIRDLRDVSPLISANWNQDYSWNTYCPSDGSGPGGYVYAGCVAVAMAQVMKYWEHPAQGSGSHSYYCSPYGTLSADFENTTYNWSSMSNSSPTNAARELLYHCGIAVEMEYSPYGSGAWVGGGYPSAITAMETFFDYDNSASFKLKNSYSDTEWASLLRTNLDNGRPLVYRGMDGNYGHAFNLDGYQGTSYFHFNWGWDGSYNGYYYLNDLTPGWGNDFTDDQGGIFNLYPDANASITVTSPNSGDVWQMGTTQNIEWTSQSVGNYVKIQLYKNTNLTATLISSTLNNGSYSWTIPESFQVSNDYKIKIIDVSNASIYDYSDFFSLSEAEEGLDDVVITAPNVQVNLNQTFEVGISTSELLEDWGVISYEVVLTYDKNIISYDSYSLDGTIAEGGMVALNPDWDANSLKVSYMNMYPISGEGDVIKISFNAISVGTTSLVLSDFVYNMTNIINFVDGEVVVSESSVVYGDIDGNGEIQSYDAALALQFSASLIEFEAWQIIAADVDGNGLVQSYDAALILQYSAGLIDEFPIENK